jgi:hypothetical protein
MRAWHPSFPELESVGDCDIATWDEVPSTDNSTFGRKVATIRSLDGAAHARDMQTPWFSVPVSKLGLEKGPDFENVKHKEPISTFAHTMSTN